MRGRGDVLFREDPALEVEDRQSTVAQRGSENATAGSLHVVRASRDVRSSANASVTQPMNTHRARVAARDIGHATPEAHVLGRGISGKLP